MACTAPAPLLTPPHPTPRLLTPPLLPIQTAWAAGFRKLLKLNRAYGNPDYNEDMRSITQESMLSAQGAKVNAKEKGAFEQVTAARWAALGWVWV
jgi:hypothetical protein